jgi:hypothetical protein
VKLAQYDTLVHTVMNPSMSILKSVLLNIYKPDTLVFPIYRSAEFGRHPSRPGGERPPHLGGWRPPFPGGWRPSRPTHPPRPTHPSRPTK